MYSRPSAPSTLISYLVIGFFVGKIALVMNIFRVGISASSKINMDTHILIPWALLFKNENLTITPTAFYQIVASHERPHARLLMERTWDNGQWLADTLARLVSPTESIGEIQSHVNNYLSRSRWRQLSITIGQDRHSKWGTISGTLQWVVSLNVPRAKMVTNDSVRQSNTDNSWGGRFGWPERIRI